MIAAGTMHLVVELVIPVNHKAGPQVHLQALSLLPTCRNLDLVFAQVVGFAERSDEPAAALIGSPAGRLTK